MLDLTMWYQFIVPWIKIYKLIYVIVKKWIYRYRAYVYENIQSCPALGYAIRETRARH